MHVYVCMCVCVCMSPQSRITTCVVVCCSMLQHVAVYVLHCFAVCCGSVILIKDRALLIMYIFTDLSEKMVMRARLNEDDDVRMVCVVVCVAVCVAVCKWAQCMKYMGEIGYKHVCEIYEMMREIYEMMRYLCVW